MAYFTPFVGKDIFKVDGSLKAKYAYNAPSFEGKLPDGSHVSAHCWPEKSYGKFELNVKICVNGGSYDVNPVTAFCQYERRSIELFDVKDGILTASVTNTNKDYLNKEWDASELQAHANKVIEAQKQYEAILDGFPYVFSDVCHIKRIKY